MADETASTTGTEETNGQSTEGKEFTAIMSQEDFDKAIQARIARERAKFSDYDQIKAAADKLAQLEESQKTEAQKQSDALQKAQQELAVERASRLRAEVAAQYGISTKKGSKGEPSDADLFLTGNDEATLTAQAERLVQREQDRKKQGNVAPKEGGTRTTGNEDVVAAQFAQSLFGDGD